MPKVGGGIAPPASAPFVDSQPSPQQYAQPPAPAPASMPAPAPPMPGVAAPAAPPMPPAPVPTPAVAPPMPAPAPINAQPQPPAPPSMMPPTPPPPPPAAPPIAAPQPPAPPMVGAMPPPIPQMPSAGPPSAGPNGFSLQSLNLGQVSDGAFRRLDPTLDYEAIIRKAEIGKSAAQKVKFTVLLEVTYPPQYHGANVQDDMTLEGNCWRFKSLCRACDALSEDNARFTGNGPAHFLDYIVGFNIRLDEYTPPAQQGLTQGEEPQVQVRNKIDGGYRAGSLSPELQPDASAQPQQGWTQPQ